jgi:hypothetical protein
MLAHSVRLQTIQHALNALRMLRKRLNKATGNLRLIAVGCVACLTSQGLNRIENSHTFAPRPDNMPVFRTAPRATQIFFTSSSSKSAQFADNERR